MKFRSLSKIITSLSHWRPFFNPSNHSVKKIATWVRNLDLLVELYNREFLLEVGDLLGTMLKIDESTTLQNHGKFAQIYVELDL